MKYFRLSLVTAKSLIFLFVNKGKDKHKPSETKRQRWNWNIFLKSDIYDAF